MLFFNASLRTRLSTEKAAKNLGMDVMVLNVSNTWNLEFEDGTVMNLDKAEHIKEAAKVISEYADIFFSGSWRYHPILYQLTCSSGLDSL